MKTVLCVLMMALIWTHFVSAKETFYSGLESKESVEQEGGTIDGGRFDAGKFGNGFVSEEAGDVIHFPVEGRFTNLDEGTVELWVKMGLDNSKIASQGLKFFLFMTYKRGTDALWIMFGPSSDVAQLRIKSAGTFHDAVSDPLNWKEGEIHHMAGTWGPAGMKLYLDGKLAGTNDFKGGPTVFSETLEINNASPPDPNYPTNCVVDEVRISDHQKTPDELVMNLGPVQPAGKLSMTWGSIKNAY